MNRLTCSLLLCLCTAFAVPARADEAADKRAAILQLVDVTRSRELGAQMTQSVSAQLRHLFPTVPEALWKELTSGMSADEYASLVVPIYEKHFSLAELRALLAFYQSPAGRKFVAEMPAVLQESMQVGQAWGQQKAAEIIRKLKEKGYEPTQA